MFGFTQGRGGHFLIDLSVKAGAQPPWVTPGARGGDGGEGKRARVLVGAQMVQEEKMDVGV